MILAVSLDNAPLVRTVRWGRSGLGRRSDLGASRFAVIVPERDLKVVVATRPVDFRRGMNGLVALVASALKADPYCGDVFVFRPVDFRGELTRAFHRELTRLDDGR